MLIVGWATLTKAAGPEGNYDWAVGQNYLTNYWSLLAELRELEAVTSSPLFVGGFEPVEVIPIVRVAPAFPQAAIDQGLSGSCAIEFTVTTGGRVADPSVVFCSDPVFEMPSIEAILQFRYSSRPRAANCVRQSFDFVL